MKWEWKTENDDMVLYENKWNTNSVFGYEGLQEQKSCGEYEKEEKKKVKRVEIF